MICASCGKDLKQVKYHIPDVDGEVCGACRARWRRHNVPGVKERTNAHNKKYRDEHPELVVKKKEYNQKYYEENSEELKQDARQWVADHPEQKKAGDQARYLRDKETILDRNKEYRQNHKDEIRIQKREATKLRKKTDLNFRIACNQRTRLNSAIHGGQKSGSAVRDLGCSIDYLKMHLDDMFYPDVAAGVEMTWENWGKGAGKWQIDHMRPVGIFELSDQQQLLECVNYTNLQPLWFDDHNENSIHDRNLVEARKFEVAGHA